MLVCICIFMCMVIASNFPRSYPSITPYNPHRRRRYTRRDSHALLPWSISLLHAIPHHLYALTAGTTTHSLILISHPSLRAWYVLLQWPFRPKRCWVWSSLKQNRHILHIVDPNKFTVERLLIAYIYIVDIWRFDNSKQVQLHRTQMGYQ